MSDARRAVRRARKPRRGRHGRVARWAALLALALALGAPPTTADPSRRMRIGPARPAPAPAATPAISPAPEVRRAPVHAPAVPATPAARPLLRPRLPNPPPPGSGPGIDFSGLCADFACIEDVKRNFAGGGVRFHVRTSRRALVTVFLSQQPLTPQSLASVPDLRTADGGAIVRLSSIPFDGYDQGVPYHYLVKAEPDNGKPAMWEKGTFKVGAAKVRVEIEKVVLNTDGDGLYRDGFCDDFKVEIGAFGAQTDMFGCWHDAEVVHPRRLGGVNVHQMTFETKAKSFSIDVVGGKAGPLGYWYAETGRASFELGTLAKGTEQSATVRLTGDFGMTVHLRVTVL